MYRRYQATPQRPMGAGASRDAPKVNPGNGGRQGQTVPEGKNQACQKEKECEQKPHKRGGIIKKLIPQSIYNSETGKVFGFLSADDLFLIALIILMIDNGDDGEDNSMLIYALIYILVSEHIDLPF